LNVESLLLVGVFNELGSSRSACAIASCNWGGRW